MPPPLGGSSRGCPAVWSNSHHKGYCSRLSMVRPPHPCGLSCGAAPLGRRPPSGLCTGSPVTGCFHGSDDVCHGPRCSLAGLGPVALDYRSCHWLSGSAGSPQHVRPMGCWFFPVPHAALRVCGVLGNLAPVHRCARSVRCVASAVSRATWLLFTGALVRCVALLVRCPGPLGSCSPVCSRGLSCCVCGVLGHLTPVHRCARSVCGVVCGVSWVTWLLFTSVSAWCAALCVPCPGPLGSCSPVRPFGVLLCLCGVLGHLAPVHRCARMVCCVACASSWATWLLFTGAPARCVVLCVGCPGSLGSCSPVCPLGVLLCVCGVLGNLAAAHRCAWPWCPVPLLSLVLVRARCPGPGGACSPACALCAVCVCRCRLCLSSSPPNFSFFFRAFSSLFFFREK